MRHNINLLSSTELIEIMNSKNSKIDQIIKELEEYEKLYLPEPKKNWDIDEFKKRVYERAAINELEVLVRLNPDMTIRDIFEEFMYECDNGLDDNAPIEVFEILKVMSETTDAVYIHIQSHKPQLLL